MREAGLPAMNCYLKKARETNPNSSFTMLGDNIGASPYISGALKDNPTIAALNTMNPLASTIGNHELDMGQAVFKQRVDGSNPSEFVQARFPYLGANIEGMGTYGDGTPYLGDYKLWTSPSGMKVAFIGAIAQDVPYKLSPGTTAGLTFTDPIVRINALAAELKTSGTADVKDALEQQWKTDLNSQNSRPMLKLGLSSNVRYTYDPARPYGERITSVTINGEPLKADATYTVGSVTFLLAGGDSFEALTRGGAATTNGNLDRDSFNAYLGAHASDAASVITTDGAGQASVDVTVVGACEGKAAGEVVNVPVTVATDFATVVEAGDGLTIPVTCAGAATPNPSPSADAAGDTQSGNQAAPSAQHKNTKSPKGSLARTGADLGGLAGAMFVGAIGVAGVFARRRCNRYQSENKLPLTG